MLNIVTLTKKGRNREVTYQGFELDAETGLPIIPANPGAEVFAELVNAGFTIERVLLAFAIGENRLRASEAIDADLFAGVIPADATDFSAGAFRRTVKNQAKFADMAVSEVAALLSKKWNWKKEAPAKKEKKSDS
jgi:hypothetical protein